MRKKNLVLNSENFERIPSGKQWQKVLLKIYERAPHTYGHNAKMAVNDNNHPLAKVCKISGYELMLALSFLQNHKLITHTTLGDGTIMYLTEEGFQISFELEKQKKEFTLQKTTIILSLFLVVTGIFQVVIQAYPENRLNNLLAYLAVLAIITLVISLQHTNHD